MEAGVPAVARMNAEEVQIVWFTAWVAALSTALILPPGLLAGWVLARFEWRGKSLLETLLALPLVMPPVATGLILLKILGRRGWVGGWVHDTFISTLCSPGARL